MLPPAAGEQRELPLALVEAEEAPDERLRDDAGVAQRRAPAERRRARAPPVHERAADGLAAGDDAAQRVADRAEELLAVGGAGAGRGAAREGAALRLGAQAAAHGERAGDAGGAEVLERARRRPAGDARVAEADALVGGEERVLRRGERRRRREAVGGGDGRGAQVGEERAEGRQGEVGGEEGVGGGGGGGRGHGGGEWEALRGGAELRAGRKGGGGLQLGGAGGDGPPEGGPGGVLVRDGAREALAVRHGVEERVVLAGERRVAVADGVAVVGARAHDEVLREGAVRGPGLVVVHHARAAVLRAEEVVPEAEAVPDLVHHGAPEVRQRALRRRRRRARAPPAASASSRPPAESSVAERPSTTDAWRISPLRKSQTEGP